MDTEIRHWILLLRIDDAVELFDSLVGGETDVKPLKKLSTKFFSIEHRFKVQHPKIVAFIVSILHFGGCLA